MITRCSSSFFLSKISIYETVLFYIDMFFVLQAMTAKLKLRNIIASSLTEVNNNNNTKLTSVLQGLLSEDDAIPIHENFVLLDSIIDLLFAGSQTVTSAGFSLVYQLTKRDDVMSKIRTEMTEKNIPDNSEPVTARCVAQLSYVNAVVKETLRMQPPVGGAYREVLEPFEMEVNRCPVLVKQFKINMFAIKL